MASLTQAAAAFCTTISEVGRVWGKRDGGESSVGDLDQIQVLLRDVSIQTTERYLGYTQKLRCAVNDHLHRA